MDRILISGLRQMGVHGVLAEEQERAQPFGVELELLVDLRAAGQSDALADTVDYGAVCDAVRAVIADEHHQLLERLAERITDVLAVYEKSSSSRLAWLDETQRQIAANADIETEVSKALAGLLH